MKLLTGVGPTVTATGIHHCDIHNHHTMIENIHVVQSIIPLHGPDDIQGEWLYYYLYTSLIYDYLLH